MTTRLEKTSESIDRDAETSGYKVPNEKYVISRRNDTKTNNQKSEPNDKTDDAANVNEGDIEVTGEDSTNKDKDDVPNEPTWVWIALVGGCYVFFIFAGTSRCYGLLYLEFLDLYGQGPVATTWIQTFRMLVGTIVTPIAGYMIDVFPMRTILLIVGPISCSGLILASFAPTLGILIIGQGLMMGIVSGSLMTTVSSTFNRMFRKRRSLANGIMAAAASVGSITLPHLYGVLLETYTVRGTQLVISGLWLNMVVVGVMFVPWKVAMATKQAMTQDKTKKVANIDQMEITTEEIQAKDDTKELEFETSVVPVIEMEAGYENKAFTPTDDKPHGSKETDIQIKPDSRNGKKTKNRCGDIRKPCRRVLKTYSRLLRSFELWLFLTFRTLANLATNAVNIFLPAFAAEQGLPLWSLATLLSVIGVSELVSRIILGYIGDWECINKVLVLGVVYTSCGVITLSLVMIPSVLTVYIMTVFLGLFGGIFRIYNGPILVDIVGFKRLGSAMGLLACIGLLTTAASQPFFGYLRTATGTFGSCFIAIGATFLMCGLVAMLMFINSSRNCSCGQTGYEI